MTAVQIKGLGRREVTPWLNDPAEPVCPGLYQRRSVQGEVCWARWNRKWYCVATSRELAAATKLVADAWQIEVMAWRGLSKPWKRGAR